MKINISSTQRETVDGLVFSWIEFEFLVKMISLHDAGVWVHAHMKCLKANYSDRALTSPCMISLNLVFLSVFTIHNSKCRICSENIGHFCYQFKSFKHSKSDTMLKNSAFGLLVSIWKKPNNLSSPSTIHSRIIICKMVNKKVLCDLRFGILLLSIGTNNIYENIELAIDKLTQAYSQI